MSLEFVGVLRLEKLQSPKTLSRVLIFHGLFYSAWIRFTKVVSSRNQQLLTNLSKELQQKMTKSLQQLAIIILTIPMHSIGNS